MFSNPLKIEPYEDETSSSETTTINSIDLP